jgi:tetratricopeptide (TPR) repeat protein
MKTIKSLFLTLLITSLAGTSYAQLKTPQPSPTQTLDQAFGLSSIKIEYSRPSVKGRTVFGDLVPFGKIWRTGANAATKITFGDDVKIEGNALAAGTYAVYTIPNQDSWDVMFYKDLKLGGNVAEYKTENEALKVKVKPATIAYKTETFTMNVADVTSNAANIEILWDKTRVAINVTTDIDTKIMKSIDDALKVDTRPFYQAASYYYENGKDLNQALTWVNKATESNPTAYWVWHLKAKIQSKLNDSKGAVESAEKSMALAKEAKNDDYVKLNEKLIGELKKK